MTAKEHFEKNLKDDEYVGSSSTEGRALWAIAFAIMHLADVWAYKA